MPKRFWGKVLEGAGLLTLWPVAVAKGAIDAANGGSYNESVRKTMDSIGDGFGAFGDRHADHIEKTILTGITKIGADEYNKTHNKES
jgi:hypothetical protein